MHEAQGVFGLINVTEPQLSDMALFQSLVRDRGQRMNLVGPSFHETFWLRHALDSAQLFHVEQFASRWADVGTGAGLPGVILAILLKGVPNAEVHLIESLGKRVSFLHDVCRQLDLPAVVHHGRAEDLSVYPEVDVVTARACAPLDRLLNYTYGFFKNGARGAFLKGRSAEIELHQAQIRWQIGASFTQSLSDPQGRIVRVSAVSPRG